MKRFSLFIAVLALLSSECFTEAHAMVGSKVDMDSLTSEQEKEIKQFINTEVKADLSQNFEERIHELSVKTQVEPPMSKATQGVLLKAAFLSLSKVSLVPINEEFFNRNVGKSLAWLSSHGMVPHAVTVGALARKTWGEGYTAGFNYGAESNLYLHNGKVMMTNYKLRGGQVGVGTPFSDVEFYIAFCFGSCYDDVTSGWYLGGDMDLTAGVGAGFFAELGVDVSSLYQQIFKNKEKKKFTVKDMYEASTFYLGFGIDVGVGADAAIGLYHYNKIGSDLTLADPGKHLNAEAISSQIPILKP